MEEDLANDQSIDGKIEREVRKIAEVTEKKLRVKIQEAQRENMRLIELLQKESDDNSNKRNEQTQLYI